MKWWDRMPWSLFSECWALSQLFYSPLFTFTKRLFSSSLSAIRVVSSAYLRWLIFLPAVSIPTCASSSPAFLMMYPASKLNKQGDNIQSWRTPFPIWSQIGNSKGNTFCYTGVSHVSLKFFYLLCTNWSCRLKNSWLWFQVGLINTHSFWVKTQIDEQFVWILLGKG